MPIECYAATRSQDGRAGNEDAFLIGRGKDSYAALADGAGNAERAAKRVLAMFGKLYAEAPEDETAKPEIWVKWVRLLDSALQGGAQSTFVAVGVMGDTAVGACVGDSRAYLLDRDGELVLLTEAAGKPRLGSGRAEAFPINRKLATGEVMLLLSDGAWTPLGSYLLKKAVVGSITRHFSELPGAVLEAAGRTGRADDMTVVALRLKR